ncbi:MAG: PIN domain-containing protein [Bryobacteraceae bacterium]
MATLLLDSNVIFDALNGKRNRAGYLQRLLAEGHLLACCAVNFTEVYAGLRDHEAQKTERFMNSLEVFPLTRDVAVFAGLLKREWSKKGITLSYPDVTIAAVALFYAVPLLTDNRKDFPMQDLHLFPLPDTF